MCVHERATRAKVLMFFGKQKECVCNQHECERGELQHVRMAGATCNSDAAMGPAEASSREYFKRVL